MVISCMPAKILDYGVFPSTYEVELADSAVVGDAAARSLSLTREFADAFGGSDVMSRAISFKRMVYDYVASGDYLGRAVSLHVSDGLVAGDAVRKGRGVRVLDSASWSDRVSRGITVSCGDAFLGEFHTSRGFGINRTDGLTGAEALVKGAVKNVYDSWVAGDLVAKHGLKILEDLAGVEDYFMKSAIKRMSEEVRFKEVVAKVGYTLTKEVETPAGKALVPIMTRRVYFLPEEYEYLWDKILPEDHNVKVDACRTIYSLLAWAERILLGLRYPGPLRDCVAVSDYVAKRVTIARRDRIDWKLRFEGPTEASEG